MLTIALAKGRLFEPTLRFLHRAGIRIPERVLRTRKLTFGDRSGKYNFILVKASDVPVYVEYGIADAGICGLDVVLETKADVHQPLDLGFGHCRIVVARKKSAQAGEGKGPSALRVATKYPRIAEEHFRSKGVSVEIIVLSGSVELAPNLGLAEQIVDLVQTGKTLRENGLEVADVIAESTARLILNRASYHLKQKEVASLIGAFELALANEKA